MKTLVQKDANVEIVDEKKEGIFKRGHPICYSRYVFGNFLPIHGKTSSQTDDGGVSCPCSLRNTELEGMS